MEMRMYQRSWHGIDLTSIPAAQTARDKPASAEFYAQFYKALASGQGKVEPGFLAGKRQLGEAIERDIIGPWKKNSGRSPTILALAAGTAAVERVWREHGHQVTFNDCQEESLAETRRAFPDATFLVGDVSNLSPKNQYDLITAITVDYVMSRSELTQFLRRIRQWLQPGGQIILYCASTLSFRQIAVESIKQTLGYYRRTPYVFWGYWRTPGEFSMLARCSDLRVVDFYDLNGDVSGGLRLHRRASLFQTLPPFRSSHLLVTLEPR